MRLDSPVLRLAYLTDGTPAGVDLLSGERVIATRAIVSNLTIWDTFGKLIGPARTPREISAQLKRFTGWGVYQMFLVINESALSRLPAEKILMLTAVQPEGASDPQAAQLVLSVAPAGAGPPDGSHRTAVLSRYTRAEDWFSFHEDHTAHEERDQSALEQVWSRLHAAMPELGDGIELIETATPQTYYDMTRRRFGMIGRASGASVAAQPITSPFPNLWLVGDTVADGVGLEGVVESAWRTALEIVG